MAAAKEISVSAAVASVFLEVGRIFSIRPQSKRRATGPSHMAKPIGNAYCGLFAGLTQRIY